MSGLVWMVGAPPVPAEHPGLSMYLDVWQISDDYDAEEGQWPGRTSLGASGTRTFFQNNEGARPAVGPNFNGHASVEFDGVGTYLVDDDLSGPFTEDEWGWAVIRVDGLPEFSDPEAQFNDPAIWSDLDWGTMGLHVSADSKAKIFRYEAGYGEHPSTPVDVSKTIEVSTLELLQWKRTGGNVTNGTLYFRRGKGSWSSTTVGLGTGPDEGTPNVVNTYLNLGTNGYQDAYFNGCICELALGAVQAEAPDYIGVIPTDEQFDDIADYLASYWLGGGSFPT